MENEHFHSHATYLRAVAIERMSQLRLYKSLLCLQLGSQSKSDFQVLLWACQELK